MKTLLLFLSAVLAGCVSISYSPIQADSPAPPVGSPPLCEAVKPPLAKNAKIPEATLTLAEGDSCMFPVRADRPLTRTPLAINPGETYRVTIPRNQVWYDASRRNIPPDGEPGSWMMNWLKHWKQHPDSVSKWFALIAVNVSRDSTSAKQHISQDVSIDPDLKVTHLGQLAFYPNDAIVPVLGDFFYSNNSGQVWVQIEHCPAVCTSKLTEAVLEPCH